MSRVLVVSVLFSAAAAVGCVHVVQEQELLPGSRLSTAEPTVPSAAPDLEVVAADGSVLRGHAFTGAGRPLAIVYFGGNGEIVTGESWLRDLARRHDVDVYAVNYRGFGPSDGVAGLEAIHADSLRIFDAIADNPEIRDRPIVVFGFSLGTVAALTVATSRPVAGIVLQGAPTTAAEVVPKMRRALPWYARPFVRLRAAPEVAGYEPQPIDLAPSLQVPLLSIHGARDVIVAESFGRRVFDVAGSAAKTFCEVEGAGHNDLWTAPGEKAHACLGEWLKGVKSSLEGLRPGTPK